MNGKKLLVVDDEPQIAALLSEAFSPNFEVMTACSGEEAIRKAVLDHPSCILMDVMMPRIGGFMLCEILKSIKQTKLIPILMVSAKPSQDFWPMAQELGAFDYIEKPFSIEKLSQAVERALRVAPIERRRTPRVKMKIPVRVISRDLSGGEVQITSETEDVSRFGALLRLPILIPVGQEVELRQELYPTAPENAVSTRARVIWHDGESAIGPYRHGIEFLIPSSHWVIRQ